MADTQFFKKHRRGIRQPRAARKVYCNGCTRVCRGGSTRVMRFVVFHWCADCWSDRRRCEQHMIAAVK